MDSESTGLIILIVGLVLRGVFFYWPSSSPITPRQKRDLRTGDSIMMIPLGYWLLLLLPCVVMRYSAYFFGWQPGYEGYLSRFVSVMKRMDPGYIGDITCTLLIVHVVIALSRFERLQLPQTK